MKKTFFGASLALSLLLAGCANEQAAEISQLNDRIRQDSILLSEMGQEMTEIDEAIEQVLDYTAAQEGLEAGGIDLSDASQAERLGKIEEIIKASTAKIERLEADLAKSQSSLLNNAGLRRSIAAQKKLLSEQQAEINRLSGRVEELEVENSTLREENATKTAKIERQSNDLQAAQATVQEAENRLRQIQDQVNQAQKQNQAVNDQINREYMQIAATLIEMAEDRKGLFGNGKKQRKEMCIKAMQYLCMAHQRGVYQAMTEINILQGHKKLGKYVKYESCNSVMNK